MAKRFFIVVFIFSLLTLAGCTQPDSGVSRIIPPRTSPMLGTGHPVKLTGAGEIDIVEQIATNRQAYREGLERLVKFYTRTGDNEKLGWANKELKALNVMPQYKYIVPVVAPKSYRATTSIPDADLIYEDALLQKNRAEKYSLALVDKDLYRMALRKFENLITKYPNSDKIDDSAYMAGGISEYFKDYSIALDYYQLAYTWDPDTSHPARFKAARILDKHMQRNAEALALYIEAVEIEGRYGKYRELKDIAEERIEDLQKSGQGQP